MIALNEGHNMESVLQNLLGWAQEVFLVDSFSQDETIDIALRYGVHVVQRPFKGFGDQWNFALENLPIKAPWTMKLDPDERLSDELKASIVQHTGQGAETQGLTLTRRLWFMEKPLPVRQKLVRLWKTGNCRFTDIAVNEYPCVNGNIGHANGDLQHHDSPDLDHWLEKQNRYTTAEAIIAFSESSLADTPKLMGTAMQRRMWLKKNFYRIPFRYTIFFLFHWLAQGAWQAGWAGYAWSRLRADVMRLVEYKRNEMELTGRLPGKRHYGAGKPDARVMQY